MIYKFYHRLLGKNPDIEIRSRLEVIGHRAINFKGAFHMGEDSAQEAIESAEELLFARFEEERNNIKVS